MVCMLLKVKWKALTALICLLSFLRLSILSTYGNEFGKKGKK